MEVRSISSSSLQPFAPGPHRRSHPNLQHLSLAPLQPKYPITPSDYDAYIDPQTSNLHTSASLSRLSSPTTPPIPSPLSHSRSANPSSTRLNGAQRRMKKEQPLPQPLSTATATSASKHSTNTLTTSPASLSASTSTSTPWFIQTGLTITSSTAESKGQAWLSKRESSTSLLSPGMTPPFRTPVDETRDYGFPASASASIGHHTAPSSRPHTPNTRSRRPSRSRVSRRDLAMTPAAAAEKLISDSLQRSKSAGSSVVFMDGQTEQHKKVPCLGDVPGGSRPDWADEKTKREAAREERERELIESSVDWQGVEEADDEDEGVFEYAVVDGELVGEAEDRLGLGKSEEQELQKQVRHSAFGIGKWVDGWVDALLQIGDDHDDEVDRSVNASPLREKSQAENEGERGPRSQGNAGEQGNVESVVQRRGEEQQVQSPGDGSPRESAPKDPASVWEDVRWLGRVVWDTAIS